MNICLIHSSFDEYSKPTAPILPIGTIALSDLLNKEGYNSWVLNIDLKLKLEPEFNLIDYLKAKKCAMVGFTLHWHSQSKKTIELIQNIKTQLPKIKVVVGGYTASFFAKEILEFCPEIDFIIKGEAEIPLIKLSNYINSEKENYEKIPNLVWKKEDRLISNPLTYVADEKMLNNLCFTNFGLIEDYNNYLKCISVNEMDNNNEMIFYFVLGRGCNLNCTFCGGSKTSQKIINKRDYITTLKPEKVIKVFKEIKRYDINRVHIAFDPFLRPNYFKEIFQKIRENKLEFTMEFECFKLPTKEFVDDFKNTFKKDSYLIISPESGSEKVRKLNRDHHYSNKQLTELLDHLESKNINVMLCFTAGLPFEEKSDVLKTFKLIRYFKKRYKNVQFALEPIILDPGSLLHLYPEKYKVLLYKKSFKDFFFSPSNNSQGYRNNFFADTKIIEIIKKYRKTLDL